MENKELHIASKEITARFGDAVITTKQFLNLLADYGAFKDIPASKQILADLQKSGFGSYLYDLKQKQDKEILEKCYSHRQEFLSNGKYRDDITVYVYASMLYALGLIEDVSEPKVNNPFSAEKSVGDYRNSNKDIQHLDLDKIVELLKRDYLLLIKEIIVPEPSKECVASGFYSTSTRTKLLVIEEKLRIIGEIVNNDYSAWCKEKKNEELCKYDKDEDGQRENLLNTLKKKYIDTFKLYHKPTGRRFNGYFDESTLSLQKSIETDIIYLCSCIGKEKDWCSTELNSFLSKQHSSEKLRKILFAGTFTTAAAAIVTCVFAVSAYLKSADDRAQFEETYAMALAAYNDADYVRAVDLYNKACDGYKSSWKRSSYKEQAHGGAITASNKIFSKEYETIQRLISESDYVGAYLTIKSLPQNLTLDAVNQGKLLDVKEMVESNIESSLKNEVENLISQIFTSNGHLSANTQHRLDQMLTVDNNNYWLKFIKDKVQ
jgi:hypothetical protein